MRSLALKTRRNYSRYSQPANHYYQADPQLQNHHHHQQTLFQNLQPRCQQHWAQLRHLSPSSPSPPPDDRTDANESNAASHSSNNNAARSLARNRTVLNRAAPKRAPRNAKLAWNAPRQPAHRQQQRHPQGRQQRQEQDRSSEEDSEEEATSSGPSSDSESPAFMSVPRRAAVRINSRLRGADLYVVRLAGDPTPPNPRRRAPGGGSAAVEESCPKFADSRPCWRCLEWMAWSGVRRVYWSTPGGKLEGGKVSALYGCDEVLIADGPKAKGNQVHVSASERRLLRTGR